MHRQTISFIETQNRWWVYQRERFPLVAHGLLILIFSIAAVGYSHLVAGRTGLPAGHTVLISFIGSFILFALLRIADEFKDFDDDTRYRPYRAVPRGLVQLRELGTLGLMLAATQLALALAFSLQLALLLVGVWAYFALMCVEFFVPRWLKAQPAAYLVSHMLIMPLIALYASAPAWLGDRIGIPDGLLAFLVTSFFAGMVAEIGRKIRAPKDEELGVETYSALCGRGRALGLWLVMLLTSGAAALVAAAAIDLAAPLAIALAALFIIALGLAQRMMAEPKQRVAKGIELISGLWVLTLYGGLGTAALGLALTRS